MIDSDGRLTTSIPKDCALYNPDKEKPTGVTCVTLGMLYECKNHVGKRDGCLFCGHHDTFIEQKKMEKERLND